MALCPPATLCLHLVPPDFSFSHLSHLWRLRILGRRDLLFRSRSLRVSVLPSDLKDLLSPVSVDTLPPALWFPAPRRDPPCRVLQTGLRAALRPGLGPCGDQLLPQGSPEAEAVAARAQPPSRARRGAVPHHGSGLAVVLAGAAGAGWSHPPVEEAEAEKGKLRQLFRKRPRRSA